MEGEGEHHGGCQHSPLLGCQIKTNVKSLTRWKGDKKQGGDSDGGAEDLETITNAAQQLKATPATALTSKSRHG